MLEKILRYKKTLSLSAVVLIVLVLVLTSGSEDQATFQTAMVERGDIVEEISVTGRVEPSSRVDLAFERTGRVARVYKDVGDSVYSGDVLLQLENSDIVADLAQAEAKVKIEQAKLTNLLNGARGEEIDVQKVKVGNAEIAIVEIKNSIETVLESAYTSIDDAIRNDVDQLLSNPESSAPELNVTLSNKQVETNIEQGRILMQDILLGWKRPLPGSAHKESLLIAKEKLEQVSNYLGVLAGAINKLEASSLLSQTTLDGYKTDLSAARVSVNAELTTIAASLEELANAEAALTLAQQQLVLAEAPPTQEDVDAQSAAVQSAEAAMHSLQAQIGKTILRAPINGVVTAQDVNVGEIVNPGTVVTSIITNTAYKIEADVPEADIANLVLGNTARVTLDAYRDDVVFEAVVAQIDPAETIIDGVATYETTLEFLEDDARIKSGMTANIDILTNERKDVLFIPSRAVLGSGNQKIVRVVDGDSYTEVIVATGIRGIDGNIEIVDGLQEGDEVVVFILD